MPKLKHIEIKSIIVYEYECPKCGDIKTLDEDEFDITEAEVMCFCCAQPLYIKRAKQDD